VVSNPENVWEKAYTMNTCATNASIAPQVVHVVASAGLDVDAVQNGKEQIMK
jgi:hypothetical protein